MKITKNTINQLLEQAIKEYSNNIFPIDHAIEISYQPKGEYLESAKKNEINKQMIEMGLIKDFDKEYPSFLVVYYSDKSPILRFMGVPYKITICLEIAKEVMKQFTTIETKEFFLHAFAHEITHIYQEQIKKVREDEWMKLLNQVPLGRIDLANELLAEYMADKIGSKNVFERVEEKMWSKIYKRAKVR